MIFGIILIALGLSVIGIEIASLKPFIGIALVVLGIVFIYQWYCDSVRLKNCYNCKK